MDDSERLTKDETALRGLFTEPNQIASSTLVDRFVEMATHAGARVLRCDIHQAASTIVEQLGIRGLLLYADDELFRRLGMYEALGRCTAIERIVNVASIPRGRARDFDGANASISVARLGIANSGALLTGISEGENRSVSLLADEHIAFLAADDIVPSLAHAVPLLRNTAKPDGPSAITLIAGPSKTADIEKVLVTGVHGPAALTIVLLSA